MPIIIKTVIRRDEFIRPRSASWVLHVWKKGMTYWEGTRVNVKQYSSYYCYPSGKYLSLKPMHEERFVLLPRKISQGKKGS